MNNFSQLQETLPWIFLVIIIVTIWEIIWKMIAMWKSARNNHLAWFICIGIFNTVGILPIIYILIHNKKLTN